MLSNTNFDFMFSICMFCVSAEAAYPPCVNPFLPSQWRPEFDFKFRTVEQCCPCYQHLLAVQLLFVFMDSSIFCQLPVGGCSQATYQILIDVLHVHKQPKAVGLIIACIN